MAGPIAALLLVGTAHVVSAGAAAVRNILSERSAENVLPVTKAVKLLQAMQTELEAEYKEDKETHETLECWCKKNEGEKGEIIEQAKQDIDRLEATMESSAGRKGQLTSGIAHTKKTLAENEKMLAKATALRKEEAAAFHEQEKSLIVSVKLLEGAIIALSKHHPAMLQANSDLVELKPKLRHLIDQHMDILDFLRTSDKKDMLLQFLDASDDLLDPPLGHAPTFMQRQSSALRLPYGRYKTYTPQSGQIIGVLQQMKDAFQADLPQIQEEELDKAQKYAALKGAKESEMAMQKEQLKDMAKRLAKAKETLFNAKNDLEELRASMSADQQFLLKLQETCMEGATEWEKRSKLRMEEIQAVAEAISILSTDEARDGQQATFGFVQLAASKQRVPIENTETRKKVTAILEQFHAGSPELVALLQMAKEDPFAKVVKAIDGLLAKLQVEQADDVKHRDFCISELHENERENATKTADLSRKEAQIADLESQAQVLTETIASLKKEIHELQVELQRASEDRKMENHQFQMTVSDQMTMVDALKAALGKLSAFYNRASLVQKDAPLTEAANARILHEAPKFQEYQDSGSSNHVMTLLQKLIGEAKVVVQESQHAEQEAEKAYEALITETNDAVKGKSRMITDKGEQLASVEADKFQAMEDKDVLVSELEALAQTRAELHGQCDYIIKNFEVRQQARSNEMDKLNEVKAILRGMKA